MSRIIIKFIFITATAILSTAFFFSKPSIHFDNTEYDFGEVPEDSVQTCEFVFHNKGKGTLVIEKVEGG